MGDAISSIGDAVGGAVDALGGAVSTVVNGVGSAVGGLSDAVGLPPEVGDALESFTDIAAPIGLGILTGGIGGLGLIGEVGGMMEPAGFLGGIGDAIGGALGGLSDIPGLGDAVNLLGDTGFNFVGGLDDMMGGIFGGAGAIGNIIGDVLGGSGPLGALGGIQDLGGLLPALTDGAGVVLGGLQDMLGMPPGFAGGGFNPADLMKSIMSQAGNFDPTKVLEGITGGIRDLASMVPTPSNQLSDMLRMLNGLAKGGAFPGNVMETIGAKLSNIPEFNMPLMPFMPARLALDPAVMKQFVTTMPGISEAGSALPFTDAVKSLGLQGLFQNIPFCLPPIGIASGDPNISIALGAGTSIEIHGGAQVTVNSDGSVTISTEGGAQGSTGPTGATQGTAPATDAPAASAGPSGAEQVLKHISDANLPGVPDVGDFAEDPMGALEKYGEDLIGRMGAGPQAMHNALGVLRDGLKELVDNTDHPSQILRDAIWWIDRAQEKVDFALGGGGLSGIFGGGQAKNELTGLLEQIQGYLQDIPELKPVGGGPAATGGPSGAPSTSAPAAPGTTGGTPATSMPSSGQTGEAALTSAYERNMDTMDNLMNQMANVDPATPEGKKQMFMLQQQMEKLQEMQKMIQEILKQQHDLTMSMIQTMQ